MISISALIVDFQSFDAYNSRIKMITKWEKIVYERMIPLILFILVGGLGWAIRGTGGWGGTAGAMVVGLWVSMLFVYLGIQKGIDFRRTAVLIGLGIGFGGMNGYGQMISWIRGMFYISGRESYVPIDPAIGYFNLFLVGIIWGGYGAIGLLWSLNGPKTMKYWLIRIGVIIIGYYLGFLIVSMNPSVFYPLYSEELYNYEICTQCIRTANTANSMGGLMGAFLGGYIPAIFDKNINKRAIGYSLIIILAFAIGFPLGSLWFHMPDHTDFQWSWWKQWEITVGCFGGFGIGLVYLLMLNDVIKGNIEKKVKSEEKKLVVERSEDGYLKSNRRLFQVGFIILCIYILSGASKAIPVYLGLQSFNSFDVEESPTERIFILVIGLSVLVVGQILARRKRTALFGQNETKKFAISALDFKFHLVNFMIASAGVIAIEDSKMSFIYYLFYALITLLVIIAIEFPQKSKEK